MKTIALSLGRYETRPWLGRFHHHDEAYVKEQEGYYSGDAVWLTIIHEHFVNEKDEEFL